MGGYETMLNVLKNTVDKPSPDLIQIIFQIFGQSGYLLHRDFINQLSPIMFDNISFYFKEMNQNDLRNIKKDTIDLITKILKKYYIGKSKDSEERNKVIENFGVAFAIKMLKTTFLEKRIQAIKTLVDLIKTSKEDPEKSIQVLKLIEENKIFQEIYGPNSHIQLINKSKDLLEIMLHEDKLSETELELIWASTKKGDLEGKLTILKILKEISSSLKPKYVNILLDKIYMSKSEDIIYEEVEVSI